MRESERTRIARELHDQIGPILSLTRLKLEAARDVAAGRDTHLLMESIAQLDQAIERVRALSSNLHSASLEQLGLRAAALGFVQQVGAAAGLDVHVDLAAVDRLVSPDIATACFRVLQEAVTNAVRHAHARRLDVRLAVEGQVLELVVRDNGRGFDVAAPRRGLGLVSMQERIAAESGTLHIESPSGAGTSVRARFPITHIKRSRRSETRSHTPRR